MASSTISDGCSAGRSSELALPGIAPRHSAEVNVDSTPLCSGKSRDEAGRWSLDRAFDVILNREVSFGVTSKAIKKDKERLPLLCHFGPILHRFHRVATCIPASKLRIITEEAYSRVSLQPRRLAAHSSSCSSPASDLGEGGTGDGGRRLFFLRSGANQEGARPVRSARSSGCHPAIARSHAETSCRHGESAARGGGVPEWSPRRFPASGTAAGADCGTVHVRFLVRRD